MKDVKVKLAIDDSVTPVQKHHCIPFHHCDKVHNKLNCLVDAGIIEPVNDTY